MASSMIQIMIERVPDPKMFLPFFKSCVSFNDRFIISPIFHSTTKDLHLNYSSSFKVYK